MRLLIGTSNPAKLARYRALLSRFASLEVLSPQQIGLQLSIEEDGQTPAENALLKARRYADRSRLPSLGIDESLSIPFLPLKDQPGVFVRRNGGKELSDLEMLDQFQQIARQLPSDQRIVVWTYAVCLALPDAGSFEDASTLQAVLTDQPCLPLTPGYPLSSLLLDPLTGKPLQQLTPAERYYRDIPLAEKVARLVQLAGLG